jgi:GTP cyclohydrolase IA
MIAHRRSPESTFAPAVIDSGAAKLECAPGCGCHAPASKTSSSKGKVKAGTVQPSIVKDLEATPAVNKPRIAAAVREILLAIGEDPDRDGLLDTPNRVAKAYAEIFGGLHESPAKHLSKVFVQDSEEIVICRDIEFYSMCEHHLLPFFGKAHVAYLPNGREVVGLSKLARTVQVFARRPQVQERLNQQIAAAIEESLAPAGVLVVIESEHLCMKMRGVSSQSSVMVTTAARGIFKTRLDLRGEVMNLMMPRTAV